MAHDPDGRTGRGRRPGQLAVAARFRLFLWLSARVDRPVSARIGREQWVYPSRFPRGLSSVGRSGRQGDRADRRACRGQGRDRKSVVLGKTVSVRVDLGGRRIIKKKNKYSHAVSSPKTIILVITLPTTHHILQSKTK